MADTKDKVVTVESLKAKHDYDEETYLKKSGGTITGDVTVNSNIIIGGSATVNNDATVNSNIIIGGNATVNNDVTVNSDVYTTDIYLTENGGAKGFIYGKTSSGSYVGNFQPCNENGNCTIGHGNFTAGTGNTNIYAGNNINMFIAGDEGTEGTAVFNARNNYGNMEINRMGQFDGGKTYIFGSDIYLGCGTDNVVEYKPYFSAGDTISVNISTAGYITTGSKEVCFIIPIAKPIIGVTSLTVTTDNGMVLRQGGKYTHGSASGVVTRANSYTLSAEANGNYISVRATFNNVTNAINNDTIGIVWNAVITLS